MKPANDPRSLRGDPDRKQQLQRPHDNDARISSFTSELPAALRPLRAGPNQFQTTRNAGWTPLIVSKDCAGTPTGRAPRTSPTIKRYGREPTRRGPAYRAGYRAAIEAEHRRGFGCP